VGIQIQKNEEKKVSLEVETQKAATSEKAAQAPER